MNTIDRITAGLRAAVANRRSIGYAVALLCGMSAAQAEVVTYPAPEGAELKKTYNVEVRQKGDAEWRPVDVYGVKVDETLGGKHNVRTVSMAYFDFDGEVEVKVTSNTLPVKEARVRPLSYSVPVDVKDRTMTFSLDRPRNLTLEVNGEIFDNLQLFANPMDANRPSAKDLKRLKKNKKYHYFFMADVPAGETLRYTIHASDSVRSYAPTVWGEHSHIISTMGWGWTAMP